MPRPVKTFAVANGAPLRTVGCRGAKALQFNCPRQIFVAPDGFIFVADEGDGVRHHSLCVCADTDIVAANCGR